MRARSTNILDSTYITPVVQASSKTRAAMLMLAYNAPRKPQMCHNASPPCRPTWSKGRATARPKPPCHTAASTFPCTIGYLLTGHEKIREGYVKRRAHKLHPERAGATTLARATPTCALRPTNMPMAALSYCSPSLHADLAQNVRQKRAPSCCGRPSAVASPHCRSSRRWTP